MTRVLIATHGSAGDLFPLLPIVDVLTGAGHDAVLAVPRFLGLRLRLLGRPHVTYGAATQMAMLRDDTLFADRESSWQRLFDEHIAPTLAEDTAGADAVIADWAPDVVATTTLAHAPRAAALRRSLPHVSLSLWPEVDQPDVLLHDPAVLPDAVDAVGYPYWDAAPAKAHDLDAVESLLADRSTPVVAVALASYVRGVDSWRMIRDALRGADVRLLMLNADRRVSDDTALAVGYVPLSLVAPRCAAVIHHGGLGTMFGVLRARAAGCGRAGPVRSVVQRIARPARRGRRVFVG